MRKPFELVIAYRDAVLGFEPTSCAQMNGPEAEKKYTKLYRRLTPPLLLRHLKGELTIASSLIDPEGKARAAVLDIDEGGQPALRRVLEVAHAQGLSAIGQSSASKTHDGGHVWLFFEQATEPAVLRRVADELAEQARVTAQSWPTRMAIRLPLGRHTHTGKRGFLFLQSGERIDLDDEPQAIRRGIAELVRLPRNQVGHRAELPPVVRRAPRHTSLSLPEGRRRLQGGNPIEEHNQQTDS